MCTWCHVTEICRKLFIKKAEERANKQLTAIMTRTPAFVTSLYSKTLELMCLYNNFKLCSVAQV